MSSDLKVVTLSDDERLQQLRVKFTRVRELLKKNVIKLLDVEPPSFIPRTPNSHLSSPGTKSKTNQQIDDDLPDATNDLPAEAPSRPQFCMTYSMEDDLPPGVKELTSTPKSGSSSRSFYSPNEIGRLSTFNSLSSASSQSELEISDVIDKVPVSSLKSVTLPHGLDRFPFYSSQEDLALMKKHHSQKDTKIQPEEKAKKSHFSFRKFSKRIKGKSSSNS